MSIADEEVLDTLSDDVGSLWCGQQVAVLDSPPDSFTFLRDFVHKSRPCIIRNALMDNVRLTIDDIIDRVGPDVILTVDVSPDGHADCIRHVVLATDEQHQVRQKMFVKPHELQMPIAEFRDILRRDYEFDSKCNDRSEGGELDAFPLDKSYDLSGNHSTTKTTASHMMVSRPPVVYYSKQSDCLRTEMKELFATNIFPQTFPFAEEAFGTGPPDAVNIWIGNERSVSSMHKDHYENLFYVSSGQKEFVLNPPADHLFLYEREFPCGTFTIGEDIDSGQWSVTLDHQEEDTSNGNSLEEVKTKWIEPDITKIKEIGDKFPLLHKSHPMKVLVSAGEMLYIPSLW